MYTEPRLSKWERVFFVAMIPLAVLLVLYPPFLLVLASVTLGTGFVVGLGRAVFGKREPIPVVARRMKVGRRQPLPKIRHHWTVNTAVPRDPDEE